VLEIAEEDAVCVLDRSSGEGLLLDVRVELACSADDEAGVGIAA
jgi:hypothetical protein